MTKDAASEHRNRAALAMSSIVASRPSGQAVSIISNDAGVTRRRTPSVPSTGPGASRVHTNAGRPPLHSERTRERVHPGLRGWTHAPGRPCQEAGASR